MKSSSVAWTPALYTDASFSRAVPGAFTLVENFNRAWVVSILTWDPETVAEWCQRRNKQATDGPFVAYRAQVKEKEAA